MAEKFDRTDVGCLAGLGLVTVLLSTCTVLLARADNEHIHKVYEEECREKISKELPKSCASDGDVGKCSEDIAAEVKECVIGKSWRDTTY